MTPDPNAKRVARGRLIDWTDEELDALAEIHVTEDTLLMLAFARQYGTRQLADVLEARPEEGDDDTPDTTA